MTLNTTNALPEFVAANGPLIDELTKIQSTYTTAASLLSDIHGYGSISAKQIQLGWFVINRAKSA